jgi:hypothetical protein
MCYPLMSKQSNNPKNKKVLIFYRIHKNTGRCLFGLFGRENRPEVQTGDL